MNNHHSNGIASDTSVNGKLTKKNNRRKTKKKPLNMEEPACINLDIKPVQQPNFGFVLRCRKAVKSCKNINICQHIPTGDKFYFFETNVKRMPIGTSRIIPTANSSVVSKSAVHQDSCFPAYISKEEALNGIQSGTLVSGKLRINSNRVTDAFIAGANPREPDYLVCSIANRNTALEGDVVVLQVLPESEWNGKQRVSVVVHILERVHSRLAVGYLHVFYVKGEKQAQFQPRDKRFPHLKISANLPKNFFRDHKNYASTLFIAKLNEWHTPKYGIGEIIEKCGENYDLKAESHAILLENNIRFGSFSKEALECLPSTYDLTSEEISKRLDLRKECVFTIDPLTAKDLDDALHLKCLPNGNYEIGVHIADVAFYLHEGTVLDEDVAMRATSTYLVGNVLHMLPKDMCMACSLLPGKDCATFSVIWEMDGDGNILNRKFARAIINNCVQLAYQHAQWFIENPDSTTFHTDFPKLHRYSLEDIRKRVLLLHDISQAMRKRRFANGAMLISQIKLGFTLNADGEPIDFSPEEMKDANHLIEEFMLQANISVAEKIYSSFPDIALLRCHDEANPRMIDALRIKLEMLGIHLNFDSSADIYKSIQCFQDAGREGYAKFTAINHLLAKPMCRARYFGSGGLTYGDFHHFALSIPIYTHFTSPIRRYADVMVHRLLAAAIGLKEKPNWTFDKLSHIVSNCNAMKYNAKIAGSSSCDLMLSQYIDAHRPFIVDAVVVHVATKYFEVLVLLSGSVLRIFIDDMKGITTEVESVVGPDDVTLNTLSITFQSKPTFTQKIEIFQIVRVSLYRKPKTIKLGGVLVNTNDSPVTLRQ